MNPKTLLIVLFCGVLGACGPKNKEYKCLELLNNFSLAKPDYAEFFEIGEYNKVKYLIIKGNLEHSYFLYRDKLPTSLRSFCPHIPGIKIPIKTMVSLSTTHLAAIELLDGLPLIKAVDSLQYINSKKFHELAQTKKIEELGFPLNMEKLKVLSPDLVTGFAVTAIDYEKFEKMKELKIPFVLIEEFIEKNALARAEWIKVFSLFLDKEERGKEIFNKIASDYKKLKEKQSKKKKIKVIIGSLKEGAWVAPSGNSDFSQLIRDAGGDYVWDNHQQDAFLRIPLEKAYLQGYKAKIWLTHNDWKNQYSLKQEDERYLNFTAVKEGNVFNYNKKLNSSGGNDYWEMALMRPDLLLKDLVIILSGNKEQERELQWYQRLK